MNKVFDGVQFKGVVKPGEIYILTSDGPLDDAKMLFTIRTDEEVLAGVNLLMVLICDLGSTLKKYIGIEKLCDPNHDAETYEIKLLCRDHHTDELYIERLRLERIHSFQEEYEWVKERFDME